MTNARICFLFSTQTRFSLNQTRWHPASWTRRFAPSHRAAGGFLWFRCRCFGKKASIYMEGSWCPSQSSSTWPTEAVGIYFDSPPRSLPGHLGKKGNSWNCKVAAGHGLFRVKATGPPGPGGGLDRVQIPGALKPDFLANLRKAATRQEEAEGAHRPQGEAAITI